jgi:transposase
MRPVQVRLNPWESRRLRQIRDHAASARQLKRAMCLLLSAAGQQATTIAGTIGLSLDAITDIRRRWRERGLRSLDDRPRSGRPPRVTAAYRRELRRALRRGPLACGYIFTVWSIARGWRSSFRRFSEAGISLGGTTIGSRAMTSL